MSERPAAASAAGARGRLGQRVTRGTLASVLGLGANQGLRLVGNVVLSRLLFPEAFGLMALANLLLTALQMMSNMGIQPAIIRHPRGEEPGFLDTAFTLQVLRGLLLWAIGLALAVPLARFYGEPQLASIVPAVTFTAVVLGFLSTRVATETRRIHLERVTAIEAVSRAFAVVATIAIALAYRSVWALVLGGIVGVVARVLLSHTVLPGNRDRLRLDRALAGDILSFGKWIFVSTLFTFLALRIDVALLGKLLPIGVLGVYSIGIMLPGILGTLSGNMVQTVLMPALSESYRGSDALLRANFERARSLMLPVALLSALVLALFSPPFFHYLYDERYRDAGWIAQLSLFAVWFTFLQESSGRVLLAWGDSRTWALSNVLKTAATAAGCWLGFAWGALPGLILGAAAGAALGYGFVAAALAHRGVPTLRRDLAWTVGGTALGLLCAPGGERAAAGLGLPPEPWAAAVVGAGLLAPFAAAIGWRSLGALRAQ